jgi:radical S-adenosyl methionine domain-containing protein 2
MIPSVNYHLWEPCNMRCKFCFATFQDVKNSILPKGHLKKEEAIDVVNQLAEIGFEKITFAGGEPTLCPWLSDLIKTAKQAGMTTMIVTNGTKLSDQFLQSNKEYLDWIAISIDSIKTETNIEIGRAISGKTPISYSKYLEIIDKVKKYGYGLKINTVAASSNYSEDLSELIKYAKPKRWKILQALPIKGQNDEKIDSLKITEKQFLEFVDRHKSLNSITDIIPESNEDMKGSYAMVDPAGRFYDNTKGEHNYSRPIIEIGARLAIQQVNYDFNKFINRKGIYDWNLNKSFPNKITLSGYVGSGKTTIGKLLASKLNYQFISIGNKTRDYAESLGLTIVEFQDKCLKDPELDKEIDTQFSNECNDSENLIIDYRLGFKFINNAYHIFLNISEETAMERIRKSGRLTETFDTVARRNLLFKNQFLKTYGIDYTIPKNYNLVIDVEQFNTPEELVEYILKTLNK